MSFFPHALSVLSRRLPLALGAAAALTVASAAGAQLVSAEKASLSVAVDRTAYEPGDAVNLLIGMEIESGWHTNSNQPTYDYLIATEVSVTTPEGWPAAAVQYPPGEHKSFAFADEKLCQSASTFLMSAYLVSDQYRPATGCSLKCTGSSFRSRSKYGQMASS